ncbi:sigma-70 family RNA polymerase sigma factor [Fictibacillus nanhaiensis]|uniref:RNA polymerase sigma factor n=1 Tax=Fictibacillus nanhaiensis TaxID=742169 RepID=UPI002E1BBF49|nr:sigma-70 family RNA polymerase sigma factor [Fictibacillus nanhaiensis]
MMKQKRWISSVQKRGDQHAANELISHYYQSIYTYVYKQTLNKELSLDLTQDIFISMLQSIQQFDDKKSSFKTWLYRIATYKLVDYFRSKNYTYDRSTDSMEGVDLATPSDFTLELEWREDIEKVAQLINTFSIIDQQVLRLKLFGEHTFIEIAGSLDMPESSIKTKYYAAIKKVKQRMEDE